MDPLLHMQIYAYDFITYVGCLGTTVLVAVCSLKKTSVVIVPNYISKNNLHERI